MRPQFSRLDKQARAYRADGIPAFFVAPDAKEKQELMQEPECVEADQSGLLQADQLESEVEYICCGADFCRKLPQFGRFYLHASAVVLNGYGYLFSAPSGTGKSTHTSLWLKEFPGSFLLNDDKPVIWAKEDGVTVWGSPFSGKTDLQVNRGVPLKGICFLKRGTENKIRRLREDEALAALLDNSYRPPGGALMNQLLDLFDLVIQQTGMFEMTCTPDIEAARVSHAEMSG